MITQAVLDFGTNFVTWLIGLFPSWTVPAWFTGLDGYVNQVLGAVNGTSPWIPWPLVISVGVVVISTYLVCLGIKTVLRLAAFIPFFGGAG